MSRPLVASVCCIVGVVVVASISPRAYPIGPPPAVTGGFGEGTCVTCHNSHELNSGRAMGLGDVVLSGLPKEYQPGDTYRVKVELTHVQDQGVWGFQLAARLKDVGAQAGELKSVNAQTQVVSEKGVQYVEHTADGTFSNAFEFDWVAPSGSAAVLINVAGNAANGDASPVGDYIYSTSVTIPAASH